MTSMRKIVVFILIAVSNVSANSQTLAEWTQQKKLQIQYLLDQIVANKVFIEYAEKGYEIARLGLTTIHKIKSGDLDLHRHLFRSMENANPSIKGYTRVADIISLQVRIVKFINATTRSLKESGAFSTNELDHCKKVFENLLEECLENVDELWLVMNAGELQPDGYRMTDDERIKRIDQIYADIQEKYSLCRSFSEECRVLAMHRLREQNEITVGKKINGVK